MKDLLAAKGKSVVIVGDRQPADVHAVAPPINQALGNIGTTVVLTEPIAVDAALADRVARLARRRLNAGQVQLLVMLDVNPVFTAPGGSRLRVGPEEGPPRASTSACSTTRRRAQCQWHVPSTHFLEEWSDARAHDGTASIVQPLIAPLFQGRSAARSGGRRSARVPSGTASMS